MPRKKKTTPQKSAALVDEWSYQITITRTKPRTALPDGKLTPQKVERVYQAVLHNQTSPEPLLSEANKALTSVNALEST